MCTVLEYKCPHCRKVYFLESRGSARHTDPNTSKEARHKDIAGSLLFLMQVLEGATNGKTAKEIADCQDNSDDSYTYNSITPGFAPLRRSGAMRDSGYRRYTNRGSGGGGQKQIVWIPTCFPTPPLENLPGLNVIAAPEKLHIDEDAPGRSQAACFKYPGWLRYNRAVQTALRRNENPNTVNIRSLAETAP